DGPWVASAARMARRVGSARATKTRSAVASRSGGGIEVVNQLAQFAPPTVGVAVERGAVRLVRQLREGALDDREPRPRADRLEGELDVGTARVALGQAVDVPGEREQARLVDPLDAQVGRVPVAPAQPGRPAGAQVDGGLVAEPGAEALGRGDRRLHLLRRVGELDGAFDAVRGSPPRSSSSNQLVATHAIATN